MGSLFLDSFSTRRNCNLSKRAKMGVGPSAILGSTNKFFMPWLVPRNQKDTVHAPTIFGKLGRKRREIEIEELAQEVITYIDEISEAFNKCNEGDWRCLKEASFRIK